MKQCIMMATAIISMFILTSCTSIGKTAPSSTPASTGVSETGQALRIGICTDSPPLIFKQNAIPAGIEADFARQAASELGMKAEFIEMDWNHLIPSLESGQVDVVMSGLTVTDAGKEHVTFITPYMSMGQMALVRMDNMRFQLSPETLRTTEAKIGFQKNSTGEKYVKEYMPKAAQTPVKTPWDGVAALNGKEIDVFIHNAPTIWWAAETYNDLLGLFKPLTDEQLAWAVNNTNTDLKQKLDALVLKWENNGFIKKVLDDWVSLRVEVE